MAEETNGRRTRKFAELEGFLADWHRCEEAEEGFSRVRRARVLHAIADGSPAPTPLASLFLPIRRLALAGALPVLLLSGMLAYLILPGRQAPSPYSGTLTVHKQGDQVIFDIANGDRDHLVHRAEAPDFKGATTFTTSGGRFVDRLQGDADLVFYRID